MAIATMEIFESFNKDNVWSVDESLYPLKFSNDNITRDELIEIVTNWREKRKSYIKKFNEHELILIFETQSSWKRAENALFGKTSKKFVARNLDGWISLIEKKYVTNVGQNLIKPNMDFYRLINRDPTILYKEIYNAFYTYFYSEKWVEIATLAPLAKEYINQTNKALGNFLKLSVLNEFAGLNPIQIRDITRVKESLDLLLKENRIIFHPPVTRKDKTLKERGLVYDLSKIFRRHFRSNKAKAIYSFLELDGVENSLELRTIDRLLNKWKQDRLNSKADLKTDS